jgi:hypothetical protein
MESKDVFPHLEGKEKITTMKLKVYDMLFNDVGALTKEEMYDILANYIDAAWFTDMAE